MDQDYAQIFMSKPLSQQQCQTMLKEAKIGSQSFILRQFFSVVDITVEREWCIGALQALVAVDRIIHPKEQELLQAVDDYIT
jgi:hypothetical protein